MKRYFKNGIEFKNIMKNRHYYFSEIITKT